MPIAAVPSNVISLDAARAARKMPSLSVVEDYWESLRTNGAIPMRSAIDPRAVTGVLDQMFILERIALRLARLRVAGSHLCDLVGMETRGMPFSALFDPAARPALGLALEAVFSDPAVIQMGLGCKAGPGKPSLDGAMILLPLRDDKSGITRILGAMSLDGHIGRTPRRPEIRGQSRRTLSGHIETHPDRSPRLGGDR